MLSLHTIYQRISGCIAIFNNIILIFLIIYKSHHRVGKYKYLMIYISMFELLYAILDVMGAPTIFTKHSVFVVAIYSEQTLVPEMFSEVFCDWYCVFFGVSMAIFAIHFIYRYLVVSENKMLKNHDSKMIFGMLAFPFLFGLFWLWLVRFFISPTEKSDQFLIENHLDKISVNITDVNYAGVYFWPIGEDGRNHIHWRSSIGIFIMTIAITISVAIIFLFGYKCYNETCTLIKQATQSDSFNKLQTQLFYALVLQTAIPVILMHIPASTGFIASFFNCSIEIFGEVSSVTICLYPLLDPLPNLFIINSYREAIIDATRAVKQRVFHCKSFKVHVETGTTITLDSQSHPGSGLPTN
ncbi:unnamed protein product [Caenorhabditis brenneri]